MFRKVLSLPFRQVALGAIFVAIGTGAAQQAGATPTIVTLAPFAAGLSTQAPFTADNYSLSDFASITINQAAGTFTESGVVQFNTFMLGSATDSAMISGLRNGTGTASYGLYVTFTATGTLIPLSSTVSSGSFSTLSYQMLGDAGNNDAISGTTLVDSGSPDIVLASGGLAAGPNSVTINNGLPSADVQLGLNKTAPGNLFFALPTNLNLTEDSFTNTQSVVTSSTIGSTETITITGGGGNGTFSAAPVPEPASMLLLGTGLLGTWLVGRRRKQTD